VKAFVVDRYASNGGLRLAEVPTPELRANDVLVEVHAAGVNPLDSKIRDGEFKLILPYRLPLILGNDRMRALQTAGLVERRYLLPPAARHLYALGPLAVGLKPALDALASWHLPASPAICLVPWELVLALHPLDHRMQKKQERLHKMVPRGGIEPPTP
jgi:hypothetical protein